MNILLVFTVKFFIKNLFYTTINFMLEQIFSPSWSISDFLGGDSFNQVSFGGLANGRIKLSGCLLRTLEFRRCVRSFSNEINQYMYFVVLPVTCNCTLLLNWFLKKSEGICDFIFYNKQSETVPNK